MKTINPSNKLPVKAPGYLVIPLVLACAVLRAEQIEMQNGDRYNARVVSMNNDSIVIQSDVLGTIKLARSKVANISMGTAASSSAVATTQTARAQTATATPGAAASPTNDLSTAVRQLARQTNLIEEVQNQYLTGADPAVKAKFNEMLGGLAAGTISINDLRAQAKSAAEQLRAMKKELGGGADDVLDGYLAVLDSFLRESATSQTTAVQTPAASSRVKVPAGAGN